MRTSDMVQYLRSLDLSFMQQIKKKTNRVLDYHHSVRLTFFLYKIGILKGFSESENKFLTIIMEILYILYYYVSSYLVKCFIHTIMLNKYNLKLVVLNTTGTKAK